jgi:hypothetical protein
MMARAHSIWLVMLRNVYQPLISTPYCAFTVKHEMVTFLERRPELHDSTYVLKLPDGFCDTTQELTLSDLGISVDWSPGRGVDEVKTGNNFGEELNERQERTDRRKAGR